MPGEKAEKDKWPLIINNIEVRDLCKCIIISMTTRLERFSSSHADHCIYIYFICTDHIGDWPTNKQACVNYFKICEDLVYENQNKGNVDIGVIDDAINSGNSNNNNSNGNGGDSSQGSGGQPGSGNGSGDMNDGDNDGDNDGNGSGSSSSPSPTTPAPPTTTTTTEPPVTPADYEYEDLAEQDPDLVGREYLDTFTNPDLITSDYAARSCKEILESDPNAQSGVFDIVVGQRLQKVYCDMETRGGGWTVIQRRGDFGNNATYFYRKWRAYKEGFGDPLKELWAGLETIHALTSFDDGTEVQLMISLDDFDGNSTSLIVNDFMVGDEASSYKISYKNYNSRIGNSLPARDTKFSTIDQDNDAWSKNCAER